MMTMMARRSTLMSSGSGRPSHADYPRSGGTVDTDPEIRPSRLLIVSAIAVVSSLALGFLAGRTTAPDQTTNEMPPAEGGEQGPAAGFPTGDEDRADYWGLVGVTATVLDDFDGAADSSALGETMTEQVWGSVRGRWGTTGEKARLVAPEETEPSLAVVDSGSDQTLTEVTLSVVEAGAGLVFRYADPSNYWAVIASPDLQSLSLMRVEDGFVAEAGTVDRPVTDGLTVAASTRPATIQVFVEGKLALQVAEPVAPGRTGSGLIGPPGSEGDGRWDRMLVGDLPSSG